VAENKITDRSRSGWTGLKGLGASTGLCGKHSCHEGLQEKGLLNYPNMGTLFVVGTPIGNLEDVTLRALRVLQEVSLIAAEDTRTTRRLLDRHGISTPLISYHEHSRQSRLEHLLSSLRYGDIAIVSEAGMPGISDPGQELIQAAVVADVKVVAIPGPSAPISALASSGLSTDRFLFLGFLPRKSAERQRLLRNVMAEPGSLVAFESPHRLTRALEDIWEALGDRRMAICRELTKVHEEVWRGTTLKASDHFSEIKPRGEFTLVIDGAGAEDTEEAWQSERVRLAIESLLADGIPRPAAIRAVAKLSGWHKRDVYKLADAHKSASPQ